MIRFLFRTFGFVLVAAAFAALVVDGTRSIAGGHLLQSALGDTLAWLGGPQGRFGPRGIAQAPGLLGRGAALVLAVPCWIVAGGLGLLLLHAGRRPAAGVGFSGRRA